MTIEWQQNQSRNNIYETKIAKVINYTLLLLSSSPDPFGLGQSKKRERHFINMAGQESEMTQKLEIIIKACIEWTMNLE